MGRQLSLSEIELVSGGEDEVVSNGTRLDTYEGGGTFMGTGGHTGMGDYDGENSSNEHDDIVVTAQIVSQTHEVMTLNGGIISVDVKLGPPSGFANEDSAEKEYIEDQLEEILAHQFDFPVVVEWSETSGIYEASAGYGII